MNPFRSLLVVALLAGAGSAQEPAARKTPEAFTFLFWTDQELDPGKEDKLAPTIDAMNGIAGKRYPDALGGTIEAPDFAASK